MSKILNFKINQKHIDQLIKLQELFHSHFMTQELLNEMVSLYVKLGESLNQKKHPIKVYFMEKIRYVLSRPEINNILEKEKTPMKGSQCKSKPHTEASISEQEMEIKQLTEEAKQQVRQNHLINLNKDRQYEQTNFGETLKNKERNLKIEIQMKIKEQVGNMQKISTDIQRAHAKSQKQSQQIQKLCSKQDQSLNKRLANRKKKIRKISDDFSQKKRIILEEEQPISKDQLLFDHKQLNQIYDRFTRSTKNKAKSPLKRGNKRIDNLNIDEITIKQKEESHKIKNVL